MQQHDGDASQVVAEQFRLAALSSARRKAARDVVSDSSRREAQENASQEPVPAHHLRHARGMPRLMRLIMRLTLIDHTPKDGSSPTARSRQPSDRASFSSTTTTTTTTTTTATTSSSTAASSSSSYLAAGPMNDIVYRVGNADVDNEVEADLRRRRIYAINQMLYERQLDHWLAYRLTRRKQMKALEKCLSTAADNLQSALARRGLRRFAERCSLIKGEFDGVQAWGRQAAARRADFLARREELRAEREAEDFSRRLALPGAKAELDEPMLSAMPVDPASGPAMRRFCPWHSTKEGCQWRSRCPLSHNYLPASKVTWTYRRWAMKSHSGWIEERDGEWEPGKLAK